MSLFDPPTVATWTIGVDPGAQGAFALLDPTGQLVEVWDMPMVDKEVVAPLVLEIVARCEDLSDRHLEAWVERAQAMPNQGVATTFRYARGYGVVLGVLGARHVPTHHLPAAVWKRAAHLSKDKDVSRRRAIELWPAHATAFARKKDDGRAEAALIARHGWTAQKAAA